MSPSALPWWGWLLVAAVLFVVIQVGRDFVHVDWKRLQRIAHTGLDVAFPVGAALILLTVAVPLLPIGVAHFLKSYILRPVGIPFFVAASLFALIDLFHKEHGRWNSW